MERKISVGHNWGVADPSIEPETFEGGMGKIHRGSEVKLVVKKGQKNFEGSGIAACVWGLVVLKALAAHEVHCSF